MIVFIPVAIVTRYVEPREAGTLLPTLRKNEPFRTIIEWVDPDRWAVNKAKCARYEVHVTDINAICGSVHGDAVSQMVEGEEKGRVDAASHQERETGSGR